MYNFLSQFYQSWVVNRLKAIVPKSEHVRSVEITMIINSEAKGEVSASGKTQKIIHKTYNVDLMGVKDWDTRVEVSDGEIKKIGRPDSMTIETVE